MLSREDVHIYIMKSITGEDLTDYLDNYNKSYVMGANVEHHGYVIQETEDNLFDLTVIYERTSILEDVCKERTMDVANL